MWVQGEHNERMKNWGMLPSSQHFMGRGAWWSFEIGIRKSDKQVNNSHELAQIKQQVA
jgi:hypothetical protein